MRFDIDNLETLKLNLDHSLREAQDQVDAEENTEWESICDRGLPLRYQRNNLKSTKTFLTVKH